MQRVEKSCISWKQREKCTAALARALAHVYNVITRTDVYAHAPTHTSARAQERSIIITPPLILLTPHTYFEPPIKNSSSTFLTHTWISERALCIPSARTPSPRLATHSRALSLFLLRNSRAQTSFFSRRVCIYLLCLVSSRSCVSSAILHQDDGDVVSSVYILHRRSTAVGTAALLLRVNNAQNARARTTAAASVSRGRGKQRNRGQQRPSYFFGGLPFASICYIAWLLLSGLLAVRLRRLMHTTTTSAATTRVHT